MDSNSTLVPNPHSSSWKGERCCVKEDQFVMATYNDNHSESDHCIAYPAFPRPRLRIDSRIAALPEHEKRTASRIFQPARRGFISRQSGCIGCEVTTAKSLGGSWIGDPAVAPPTGASCHPAVSHGYAAQAGDANDVVSTAGGRGLPMSRGFQCPHPPPDTRRQAMRIPSRSA